MPDEKQKQFEECVRDLAAYSADFIHVALIGISSRTCLAFPCKPDYIDEAVFTGELINLYQVAQNTLKFLQPEVTDASFTQEYIEPFWRRDFIQIKWNETGLMILPDSAAGLLLVGFLRKDAQIGIVLLDMAKTMTKIQQISKS